MENEKVNKDHKVFWKEFFRTIKYFLVAASAGLIQFGVCTICDEVIFRKMIMPIIGCFTLLH